MSRGEKQERQRGDRIVRRSTLIKPWQFLGSVPLGAPYIIFVTVALMLAYACAVLMLPQIPDAPAGRGFDSVQLLVAVLVPAIALWLSFWHVGAAVKRGLPRTHGYVPVGITFLANGIVWGILVARASDDSHVWWLLPIILIAWLVEVCVVINPYNCVCGLAHIYSESNMACLHSFFSENVTSPELPLVHVYLSPGVYALAAGAASCLFLIPEFIGLANGWMKYEEAFRGVILCAALRDFSLAAVVGASLAWYQSSLAFLRRAAQGREEPKEVQNTCTLQIQYLPQHEETLLSFYLPNGRIGGKGSCGNGDFAGRLVSRFDKLLEKVEKIVSLSPCYRFRNSARMPDPKTFDKFLGEVGKHITEHYFVLEVRTALEFFAAVISRDREDTVIQLLCDERTDVIPWELLLLQGKFLCREFPMVRVRSIARRPALAPGRAHCVIVGASANEGSKEFAALPDVEQEVSSVRETLENAGWKVTVLVGPDATIEMVRTAFSESDRVDVFHFTGHSRFSPSDLDHSFLRLYGDARLYASRLIDLVRLRSPWLAFLNGCESARSGLFSDNAIRGLTDAMNEADVRYVVGMRWPITSAAGTVLARCFYKELIQTRSPEIALWRARLEAALGDQYDDPSWGAPCLYRN